MILYRSDHLASLAIEAIPTATSRKVIVGGFLPVDSRPFLGPTSPSQISRGFYVTCLMILWFCTPIRAYEYLDVCIAETQSKQHSMLIPSHTHTYRMYYLWPFPTDGDGFIPTLPYLGESGYSRCRRTVYSIYVYLINGLIWHVSRWFPEMGLPQTHGFQNVPYIINIHFRATMTMETPKNLIPCGAENGHHESKRPFHQWIFLIKLVKSI